MDVIVPELSIVRWRLLYELADVVMTMLGKEIKEAFEGGDIVKNKF